MDRSASSSERRSQPRRNFTGNSSNEPSSRTMSVKSAEVMSTTRFDTREWKKILDSEHQCHVVYRLLWVNRVMGQLRKEFKSKDDLMILVEMLLGFEDRTWKNSEEELQYILTMDTFTSFCKRPDHETWPDLVRKGRYMDLLKDVLRLQLVNALPTIYWVDKHRELFLLVGPQHNEEIRALFQQLTGTWNQHLCDTNSERDAIHLSDLPAHQISKETMELAFGSPEDNPGRDPGAAVYIPGAVLNVFEGIIHQTTGLGLALLPAPVEEYLQLLWHREVHDTMIVPGQSMSQNMLKLVLPWLLCPNCTQPREVGTIFGLRATIPGNPGKFVPMEGVTMYEILHGLEFCRGAFGMIRIIHS